MNTHQPVVIAGPCAAESWTLLDEVAGFLTGLARQLNFRLVFKSSFDKANRTSSGSSRGAGLDQTMTWFTDLKARYKFEILTDVHETIQVREAAAVCEWLQIPAFLCRQTDLVVEAAAHARFLNIKKGQFLAPGAMANIVAKARAAGETGKKSAEVFVTERGTTFGYGNLVVDMRALPIMARTCRCPVILDITHSTQLPATGGDSGTSGGQRIYAPVLGRAATATGYLDGYFMEVHSDPARAISDKDAQLNLKQGEALIRQLIPLWHESRTWAANDKIFAD